MSQNMFCYQCQETAGCTGCTEKEKANLLHTEPSNVPDQREEEES